MNYYICLSKNAMDWFNFNEPSYIYFRSLKDYVRLYLRRGGNLAFFEVESFLVPIGEIAVALCTKAIRYMWQESTWQRLEL